MGKSILPSIKNPDGKRYVDEEPVYNLTSLSQLSSFGRYKFTHRDFNAHMFRWAHTALVVNAMKLAKKGNILDVGCGVNMDQPLALSSNWAAPRLYVGMDARAQAPPKGTVGFPTDFIQHDLTTPFPEFEDDEGKVVWDIIVCYEVLEHMPKAMGLKLLDNIRAACSPKTLVLFSTPCFDTDAWMAENHIYEWGHEELKEELQKRWTIKDHFGTFASQRDYEHLLHPEVAAALNRLKKFYGSNIISNLAGPLFPCQSRNTLWHLTTPDGQLNLSFDDVNADMEAKPALTEHPESRPYAYDGEHKETEVQ